jgi:ABC-type histidine transport system ATPase subunit
MEHGKIIEDAAPGQIFGSPKQERTREFLKSVLQY